MTILESLDLPAFEDAFFDAIAGLEQQGYDDISDGNDILIVIKTNGRYTDEGQMRVNARVYINASNQDVAKDLLNDVVF